MNMNFLRLISLIALLAPCCAYGRQQINENCRSSVDGAWAFIGPSVPTRADIENKLIGLSPKEVNSLLGERKPYRYLTNQKKGFWYIERRRMFSEKPVGKECAEEMFDQSFLIIELQFDNSEKAVACTTLTKEILSPSIISVFEAEKSSPSPLDGEKRQCGGAKS